MNSTTYAKRTQYKPIDLLFRGVADVKSKTKKIVFVDAFQVLNDRYLGRMNVCNYFSIAETSVRLNELNIIALEELKNYHLVMKENFHIPDNTVYNVPISARFLDNDGDFNILLSTLKSNNYKKGSVILAFHGATLERLDDSAKKRYMRLRRSGYKIAVTQFGDDYNSIDIFANFTFDYLRCEAQYFDASPNKKKLLTMLIRFCNSNKIGLVMEGVDTSGQFTRFKRAGVKYVTGQAVSQLSHWVTNDFLCLPEPRDEKLTAYLQKLQKELDVRQRNELAELTVLRQAAIDKAKNADVEGIIPTAPRPLLDKSPYQVRLERQLIEARKSAEIMVARISEEGYVEDENYTLLEDENRTEEIKSDVSDVTNSESSDFDLDVDGKAFITEEDSGISAPIRPNAPEKKETRKKKNVQADLKKQAILLNEYRSGGLFGELGGFGGMLGVTLHVDSDDIDAPPLIGSYNEKGQWVDEDGNVFNGYFDIDGKWIEYEQFDSVAEGSYNEYGQWVDVDGRVYDGYFDEDGRWIDYSYTDRNGEITDNGYFDDKIGKWVPFGYFAEDGSYHRL